VNFHWRFIQDFSTKARPFFDLTRSEQVWTWSEKEQAAFKDLKTAVTAALVLVSPQELDPFQIEADSSDFAIGAVVRATRAEHSRRFLSLNYAIE